MKLPPELIGLIANRRPASAAAITIAQHVRLEKRNDKGELFEVVEVEVDAAGTRAKVTQRKPGLAPDEAYAVTVQPKE